MCVGVQYPVGGCDNVNMGGHMEKQEMEVEWKLEMENGNGIGN